LGSGQVVCLACWPAYEQEAKASAIPVAKLEELGAMARELAGGQAIEGVGGEAILRATLGHVEQPHRDWWLREWAGYPWYYFTDHGVYGSKLAPAALQILQYLPQAAGSSQLAELLFWLSGYHKLEDIKNRGDYYWKTQVEGKTATPSLDMEKLVVAIRLRGSEADRQAVLVWLAKTADSSDGRLETARNRIQKLMQESEQDYALALAEIAEFEIVQATRQARAEAGEIWLDARVDVSSRSRVISSVWCFAPDGSEVKGAEVWSGSGRKADLIAYDFGDLATDHLVVAHAHDNYGYRYSEDWTVNFLPKRVTAEQERAVRAAEPHQYFAGTGTGWVLSKKGTVAFTTQYHRDLVEGSEEYEAHQRMVSQNPIQVDEWEVLPGEGTWVVWARERSATPALRKWKEDLRQTEQVEANAMYMYANLEGERNRVATAYDEAVLAVLERDEANFGTSPVAQGTIFEVEFHPEDRQGQTQLVTNPIWDNPSGSWIKLVEDPFSGRRPAPGKNLVRVRAKNSQQVALFQYRTQNPDGPNGSGGRMVTVFGYFASVVLSPEYLEAEIAVAEKQMLDLKDLADHLRANQPKENGKAKKASKPPTRVVATFGDGEDLENSMEVAFAEALRKANGEGKN